MNNYLYQNFSFEIQHESSCGARAGILTTPHGTIETPNFIFCGTRASVKSVLPEQLKQEEVQIILANTYHLMVSPGSKLIREMGGLHKFMGWDGPLLTDSGGYQIFSLGHGSVSQEIKRTQQQGRQNLVKISEEGAHFRSYVDGSKLFLSPEKSIEIQRDLGVDIMLVLDECTPFHVSREYTRKSMELSHRWGERSMAEFQRENDGSQALYGIVQGGIYEDLRSESVAFVNSENFFGVAIGGSLGQSKKQMCEVVRFTASKLRKERPVHLLGIGGVSDILRCVSHGIDTFDCVHPTRIARHGCALVRPFHDERGRLREHIDLSKATHKNSELPIDVNCKCYTCRHFSRAYLHFLLKAREISALTLLTLHNVRFMTNLMKRIRMAIQDNSLDRLHMEYLGMSDM